MALKPKKGKNLNFILEIKYGCFVPKTKYCYYFHQYCKKTFKTQQFWQKSPLAPLFNQFYDFLWSISSTTDSMTIFTMCIYSTSVKTGVFKFLLSFFVIYHRSRIQGISNKLKWKYTKHDFSMLINKKVFDNFIVGNCNQF